MGDHAAHGRASLACCAGSGEHDRPGRELEVRRGRHDRRIVSAEFEQAATEPGCDAGRDLGAHPLGSRRADERDVGAVDERRAGCGVGDDELV